MFSIFSPSAISLIHPLSVFIGRYQSICAINRSRCAIDRSRCTIEISTGRSRTNRSIAQQLVDRATFANEHARSTDRVGMARCDRRLCRNGFARLADCAGIVWRDWPIVQELFGAIGRCAARGQIHRCKIDRNCKSIVVAN